MLATASLVAFVPTRDLDASHRFYGELLGLRRRGASPFANDYDANGTELRVTLVESLTPVPFTVLGWEVADIDAKVDELVAAGVAFNRYDGFEQDERGIWTAPSGARIAWFDDPDGNNLSLQKTTG